MHLSSARQTCTQKQDLGNPRPPGGQIPLMKSPTAAVTQQWFVCMHVDGFYMSHACCFTSVVCFQATQPYKQIRSCEQPFAFLCMHSHVLTSDAGRFNSQLNTVTTTDHRLQTSQLAEQMASQTVTTSNAE